MTGSTGNRYEPIALMTGVIGTIIGVLFFLQKFSVIQLAYEITDINYAYFFAGFALFASLVLLFTTLGLIGTK